MKISPAFGRCLPSRYCRWPWQCECFTPLFVFKAVANVKLPSPTIFFHSLKQTAAQWNASMQVGMNLRGSDCSVPHSGAILQLHYKQYTVHQYRHSNACTLAKLQAASCGWRPSSHPLALFFGQNLNLGLIGTVLLQMHYVFLRVVCCIDTKNTAFSYFHPFPTFSIFNRCYSFK